LGTGGEREALRQLVDPGSLGKMAVKAEAMM